MYIEKSIFPQLKPQRGDMCGVLSGKQQLELNIIPYAQNGVTFTSISTAAASL